MAQQKFEKKEMLQALDWLIDNFPNAFFRKANEVKPLQIGISEEIYEFYERLESSFSKKSLREALNYYSSSPAYLSCQKSNVARVDLYGLEVDVVTEEQAKYAQQRYKQRFSKKVKKA